MIQMQPGVLCWYSHELCDSDHPHVSEDSAAITAEVFAPTPRRALHAPRHGERRRGARTPAPRSGPLYPCLDGDVRLSGAAVAVCMRRARRPGLLGGQRGAWCATGSRLCPACPCTDGTERFRPTDMCCCPYDSPDTPVGLNAQAIDLCVNGEWVYQGTSCAELTCYGSCGIQ
jgi:hypothetical protein